MVMWVALLRVWSSDFVVLKERPYRGPWTKKK